MSNDSIRFQCKCGASFAMPPHMAGKMGQCNRCGEMILITSAAQQSTTQPPPRPLQQPVRTPAPAQPAVIRSPAAASRGETVCSICQSRIVADEQAGVCPLCRLPFHTECWHANFGCATYGCKNVNVLKPGPDVAISPAHIARAPPLAAPASEIPWDYILLAASVVGGLVSCVGFGLPSLLVAFVAGVYASSVPRPNMPVLAAVWVINAITFLLGMVSSAIVWWA